MKSRHSRARRLKLREDSPARDVWRRAFYALVAPLTIVWNETPRFGLRLRQSVDLRDDTPGSPQYAPHAAPSYSQGSRTEDCLRPRPPQPSNRAAASPTVPGPEHTRIPISAHAAHGCGKLSPRGATCAGPPTFCRNIIGNQDHHVTLSSEPPISRSKWHIRPDP